MLRSRWAPPLKPGVAQCHFPRMPGDFGGHMLHLCYHLFRNKQSRTAGGESAAFLQLQEGCWLHCRKHFAQVHREADEERGSIHRSGGDSAPFLSSLTGR